jgi:cytoskeletal protein RodZ
VVVVVVVVVIQQMTEQQTNLSPTSENVNKLEVAESISGSAVTQPLSKSEFNDSQQTEQTETSSPVSDPTTIFVEKITQLINHNDVNQCFELQMEMYGAY